MSSFLVNHMRGLRDSLQQPSESQLRKSGRPTRGRNLRLEPLEQRQMLDAGGLDPTFGDGGIVTTDLGDDGYSWADDVVSERQDDGKLLAAGLRYSNAGSDDFAVTRFNADGSLDSSFGDGGVVITDFAGKSDIPSAIALDGSGNFVVAGYSFHEETGYDFAIAKYNPDGSLDSSFGSDGLVTTPVSPSSLNDRITDIAIQDDGKVVAVGSAYPDAQTQAFAIVRYNPDGSLDTSFGNGGQIATQFPDSSSDDAKAVVLQGSKLVVVGNSYPVAGGNAFAMARYNGDGSLDSSFGSAGLITMSLSLSDHARDVTVQEVDGAEKILLVGQVNSELTKSDVALARFNDDGTLDATFGSGGVVTSDYANSWDGGQSVAVEASRIFVAARTSSGTFPDFAVACFDATTGAADVAFGENGWATADFAPGDAYDEAFGIAVDSDGRPVLAGRTSPDGGANWSFALARFDTAGTLDDTFGDGGLAVESLRLTGTNDYGIDAVGQPDGKIVVISKRDAEGRLLRYNTDGGLDGTFGDQGQVILDFGGVDFYSQAVALQSDGKIVAVGYDDSVPGDANFAVMRFHTDGTVDTTFGTDGRVSIDFDGTDDYAADVAMQEVGGVEKIVIGGRSNQGATNFDFAVARLDPDGSIDTSFGSDGKATTSFDVGAYADQAWGVVAQPNGVIVLAGETRLSSGTTEFAVACYNLDGTPNVAFDGDGKLTTALGANLDIAYDVAFQGDRIVVAGYSDQAGVTRRDFAVARYNLDGSLDGTFSDDGLAVTNLGAYSWDFGYGVGVSDDKIVVAGRTSQGATGYDFGMVRYNDDGSLDEGFGDGGLVITPIASGAGYDRAQKVVYQENRIVLVGYSTIDDTNRNDIALAAYVAETPLEAISDTAATDEDTPISIDVLANDTAPRDVPPSLGTLPTNSALGVPLSANPDGTVLYDPSGLLDYLSAGEIVEDTFTYTVTDGNDISLPATVTVAVTGVREELAGVLDPTFGDGGIVTTDRGGTDDYGLDATGQPDGKTIVVGKTNSLGMMLRYESNGDLDAAFGDQGIVLMEFGGTRFYSQSVAVQSDGKIVVAGYADQSPNQNDFAIARFHADGSPDTDFGTDGRVSVDFGGTNDQAYDVTIQQVGGLEKIVVAGLSNQGATSYDFAVARLNPDGTVDSSFSSDGIATRSFESGSYSDKAWGVAAEADGRIVLTGETKPSSGGTRFGVVCYNVDGSPNTSFGVDGKVTTAIGTHLDVAYSVAFQGSKIVVAGYSDQDGATNQDFAVARYHPDGSLDTGFGGVGMVTTHLGPAYQWDLAYGLAVSGDKLYVGGRTYQGSTNYDFGVARYNNDGSLDTAFGTNGTAVTAITSGSIHDRATALVLHQDKVVLAGYTRTADTERSDIALAAYAIEHTPTAFPDAASTDEDTPLSIDVLANDTDPQNDPLSIAALAEMSNLGIPLSVSADGTVLYDPNGALDSLQAGESAQDMFVYTVTDGYGGLASVTVTVTIAGVNDAPVLAGIPDVVFSEDSSGSSIDLDDYYSDAETLAEDATFELVSAFTGVSAMLDPATHVLTIIGDENYNGAGSIVVRVTDTGGDTSAALTTEAMLQVTVTPVNDTPTLTGIPDITFDEDTSDATIDLDDYYSDIETLPEDATFEVVSAFAGASAVIDAVTHVLTITGDSNFNGAGSIVVRVTDTGDGTSAALTAEDTLTVTVAPVNDQPVADSQSVTITEDGTVLITLSASDVETDEANLTFTLTSIPQGGTLTDADGNEISVDDNGNIVNGTFVGAPTLTFEPGAASEGARATAFSFTVTDRGDPDNDPLGDTVLTSAPATVAIDVIEAIEDEQITIDSEGIVRIGGTSGDDVILVWSACDSLYACVNGSVQTISPLADVTEVRIWGRDGDDVVLFVNVHVMSLLHGGAGDDLLTGGAASDLIFGGLGNDLVIGAAGNDVLVGGDGCDRIVGSAGHDILVSGDVDGTLTDDALRSLLAEWGAGQIAEDIEADELIDEALLDYDYDMLTGSSGSDWFIIGDGDKITDIKKMEKDGDLVTIV